MEDPLVDDLQLGHKRKKEEGFSNDAEEPPRKVLLGECNLCGDAFGKLPLPGKFMKLPEVLRVLRNAENILESVPPGEKNNVFFVIDDSENVIKRGRNIQTAYSDDCGPWDHSKYNSNTYYIDPMSKNSMLLRLRNGLFVRHQYSIAWNPVNPQPDPNTLIKLVRYYTTLKADSNYKRRITAISGGDLNNLALVEYSGIRRVPHKYGKRFDKRYDPRVFEKVKYKPVRRVYEEKFKDNKHGSPKSIKQVADIQCFASRKKGDEMISRVTDEKRAVLTMLAEDPSVQAVINRKDKPPCVILYSDDQFTDMKRNLEYENILGVDCSHKFGNCFATLTVYQNSRALHKETNEPLMFLGPVFLHWDEEFLTYMYFFSHIMDKLKGIKPDFEVKLESDSSLSLFKALQHSFPTSNHILNCHHLREIVTRELPAVLNGKRKECSMILQKIFDSDGIVSSPTLSAFENKILSLVTCFNQFLGFKTYLGRLQLLLYRYVCEPHQRGVSQKLWLNDSDKVVNDYLRKIKKKPYKLPDLMEKICDMMKHLMMEIEDT